MEDNSKVKVKFKLDEDHFIFLEIEESKLPIVKENNREVARLEKRKIRHESIYSLEAITEENGVELIDGTTNIEKQMIEQETIAERNKWLYKAIHKLTPRQQEIIYKVYFEGKSQREVAEEIGITEGTLSLTLNSAISNLEKLLKK